MVAAGGTKLAGGSRTALERAMGQAPLLEGTPGAAVRALAEQGTVREYRRGTYLFHQHDDAPSVYFLWRGRVEISSTSVTGHRQLHTALEPPQFFGELGVLGEMQRTATAVALEDTAVCVIPGEAFVRFLAEQPAATRSLLRALARQIAEHEALVEDLLFLDLKGRVAKRLIGLCTPSFEELPEDGSVVPSVVTHADLAALAGGSRENVTRILSELQRRRLVRRDGRRYVLANVDGLRRLAGL
jgi:CRP/FNR family transcriptional regulator/CRP/FNR family cyclic AMP-dependent transcriptional regulator